MIPQMLEEHLPQLVEVIENNLEDEPQIDSPKPDGCNLPRVHGYTLGRTKAITELRLLAVPKKATKASPGIIGTSTPLGRNS